MNIWERIISKLDFAQSKHSRIDNAEISELKSAREGKYYVIKNPGKAKYLKLTEKDHFIWSRLDGGSTVKDIVVEFFMKYGAFAFERVGGLIGQLKENFFLKEIPIHINRQIKDKLSRGTFEYYLKKFKDVFIQKEFAVKGIDKYLAVLFNKFVFLFYTRAALLIYAVISVTGVFLFFNIYAGGRYQFLQSAGSYSLGFLTLFIISTISIGIHEGAHAFTTKYYGRSVPKGGFLFYFGSPCFFADTSDIWMEAKGKRIAVSWAGPYSDIILASLCSIWIFIFPGSVLNNILYKATIINYISGFFNLNPLLELDGYFILMDWLEIPLLRKKSLDFVKRRFLKKIFKRERFSRDEKIFTVFGLLAGAWTALAVWLSIYFLKFRISRIFSDLFHGTDIASKIFSVLVLFLFIVPILLSLTAIVYFAGKKVIVQIKRSRILENIEKMALILLSVSAIIMIIPHFLPDINPALYYQAFCPIVLYLGLLSAVIASRHQQGSRFKGMATFSVFLLFLFVSSLGPGLGSYIHGFNRIALYSEAVAFFFLAVFLCQILAGFDFSILKSSEKIILLLALPITALALYRVSCLPKHIHYYQYFSIAVGTLAFFMFIPSLITYAGTKFFISFIIIDAGVIALTLSILDNGFGLRMLGSLFLVCGLVIYHLVHSAFYFNWYPGKGAEIKSEKEQLYAGLVNFTENILSDFANKYGMRTEKIIEKQFNDYFKQAELTLKDKRLSIKKYEKKSLTIDEELFIKALNFLIERITRIAGRPYAEKVLTRAHDNLYWEERELAEEYVFRETEILKGRLSALLKTTVDKAGLIKSIPFFYELKENEIEKLSGMFRIEKYPPGKIVIKQGELGNKFYVIAQGEAAVLIKDKLSGQKNEVARLGVGDYFGEAALIENRRRNATIKTVTDSQFLVLDKKDFLLIVKDPLKIQRRLNRTKEFSRLLAKIPIFAELPRTQVNFIGSKMKLLKCAKDEQIAKQGETGDTFYVIKEGTYSVIKEKEDGQKMKISELGPGEYFGEIALLADIPRTATVKVLTAGELFTINRYDFDRLLGHSLYTQKDLELASSRRIYTIKAKK